MGIGGIGMVGCAELNVAWWCGDLVTVGGIGLEEGEGGVRWKGSHPQEWAGLDWKSRSGFVAWDFLQTTFYSSRVLGFFQVFFENLSCQTHHAAEVSL